MEREEMVRLRAYEIWVSEGCPEGRENEPWDQAAGEIDNLNHAAEDSEPKSAGEADSQSLTDKRPKPNPNRSDAQPIGLSQ